MKSNKICDSIRKMCVTMTNFRLYYFKPICDDVLISFCSDDVGSKIFYIHSYTVSGGWWWNKNVVDSKQGKINEKENSNMSNILFK